MKYIGLVKFDTHWAAEFSRPPTHQYDFEKKEYVLDDGVSRYDLPSIRSAIKNWSAYNPEIAAELQKGLTDLQNKL